MDTTWLKDVHVGHCTAVMATGIVATALKPSWPLGGQILFWLALAVFVVMTVVLMPVALIRHRRARAAGTGPVGDFGMFAYPAAASVLAGHAAGAKLSTLAVALMVLAIVAWLFSSYLVVARRVTRRAGTSVRDQMVRLSAVDATWLLVAVAPLAVTTAANGVGGDGDRELWSAVATGAWGVGLIQLMLIGTLVAARLLLVPLTADDEVLPYWVFMGIVALALLGGVGLDAGQGRDPVVVATVVDTVAIVLWAFATWLLPLMAAMSIWYFRGVDSPGRYRPAMWSMVFPVGVSAAASEAFGHDRGWTWMTDYGRTLAWVGLAMWLAVVLLLLGRVAHLARERVARAH